MNLIIEIIDGVAYAVIRERERSSCKKCAFNYTACHSICSKYGKVYYYRHLTTDERVAAKEALGCGEMSEEYEYTVQWRWKGEDEWNTLQTYKPSLWMAVNDRDYLLRVYPKSKVETRFVRRPIGAWEVMK